ncbi:hypothetical protein BM1_00123 [Bipolaris maydis]|nr:hypothetical protein BM1_00123 [Bipolaris maydis]
MPSRKTKDAAHDGQEHLQSNQLSLCLHRRQTRRAGGCMAYVELGITLCARLEGVFAALPLALCGGAGGPAAEGGGRAKETRGGAEGGAGDDGGHGGFQWSRGGAGGAGGGCREQQWFDVESRSDAKRRGCVTEGTMPLAAWGRSGARRRPRRSLCAPFAAHHTSLSIQLPSGPGAAAAAPLRSLCLALPTRSCLTRSRSFPPPDPPAAPSRHPCCHAASSEKSGATDINTMAMTPTEQKRSSTGSRVLGMTGPAGEPGLPPSRPSSITTAHSGSQNRWSQASPARRGGGISVSGSLNHQSRPTTAASRTHVPLAAHGFFRPMSSQRLQQQRNQRPTSLLGHSSLYSETALEPNSNPYRSSTGSTQTNRGVMTLGLHHEEDLQPPPSRGTDITDRDMPDRTTANSTPTGAETVRSHGESITPLQRPRPQHLNLANVHSHDAGKNPPAPSKSPRSFRSSFMISSREGRSNQIRPHQGHEKLTSAEPSPRLARKEATKEAVKRELGKNYQYFSGNTAFCWGGRLQNTRDRPVNVATAILIILPACLFFGFSYVQFPCQLLSFPLTCTIARLGSGLMFLLRYPFSLRTCFSFPCLLSYMHLLQIPEYVPQSFFLASSVANTPLDTSAESSSFSPA